MRRTPRRRPQSAPALGLTLLWAGVAACRCVDPPGPSVTLCTLDADCVDGELCSSGVCTPAAEVCPGRLEVCDSQKDDDCDTLTDCDDPDCAAQACDDKDLCTFAESCQNGTCAGGVALACNSPPGECFSSPGLCIPNQGCFYSVVPPGVACDDKNACTTSDTCQSDGHCRGAATVDCTCFGNGTCDPASGCAASSVNVWTRCDGGGVCGVDGRCVACSSGWCPADSPAPGASLWGIVGRSATDAWAVGDNVILHWNGVAWTRSTLLGHDGGQNYRGVWPVSATEAWAVGGWGCTSRWNGSSWEPPFVNGDGGPLNALWGANATLIWAAGDIGLMRRWNGTSWSDDWPPSSDWWQRGNGVWGTNATNVWTVGPAQPTGPRVNHFGGSWAMDVGTNGQMADKEGWDLHGTSATNVWVVGGRMKMYGGGAGIMSFNGTSWTDSYGQDGGPILLAVWASSATEVWAAGENGLLLHTTTGAPGSWVVVDAGTKATLQDLWGPSPSDLWIVGSNSTLLRYRP